MKPRLCRICSFIFWVPWCINSLCCKEHFDKQCPLVQYIKNGKAWFWFSFKVTFNRISNFNHFNRISIIYDRIIWFFTISLSYPRMHPLSLFFSFIWYVLGSVTNTQQLLTIPIVYCYLCPSFLKNNRAFYISFVFCLEKRLFLKYFKNDFKIFWKYFLIVIVLYIFRISLCVTSP